MTKAVIVRDSVTLFNWVKREKKQWIESEDWFYFGSIGESGPGDCNRIFDSIPRVRRLAGAAGLRTFKLDSTTTSSATIAPAVLRMFMRKRYRKNHKYKNSKRQLIIVNRNTKTTHDFQSYSNLRIFDEKKNFFKNFIGQSHFKKFGHSSHSTNKISSSFWCWINNSFNFRRIYIIGFKFICANFVHLYVIFWL